MKKIMNYVENYEDRFYSSAIYEDDDTYYEDFQYSRSYEMDSCSYGMGDYQYERMEARITYRLRAIA